jgi:aminobutyraldehyde dehydrogenase
MAELFPPGVVNVVVGRGDSVGSPLIHHSGVRMVSLTGSITGQKVLQAAARDRKRTPLELGGKAPVLVFAIALGGPCARWANTAPTVTARAPAAARSR